MKTITKLLKCIALGSLIFTTHLKAQDVNIAIDASQDQKTVSPYLYGRNNTFDKPAQFYKDAGLRFARMNGGNNATKYNWRLKISSHPDWYNNVYGNDWDKTSKDVLTVLPDMQLMWAFQLLGRVASSNQYNFNDWAYNQSQWWEGVNQNLAGGGVPNESGVNPGKAAVEGDIDLYTKEWPADSTVAILDHWFGENGIGLNKNQLRYWNMDNEADVWNGTHDDVMSDGLLPASEFVDRNIEVAKKARAIFPEIKICGPVTTSEWQWYKWGEESIKVDGKYYCWLEYYIKRLADEEKASGIRLVDVIDLHNYPYCPTSADALQVHRMYYDKTYVYPGANGIKTINGGWDNSQNKEYIFLRINEWLEKHFGPNHGITIGLSEWSPGSEDPNIVSVVYASHLGTFANNGVEYFTPWNWYNGMWETMHLFSRYAKTISVSSVSSLENEVSAYTTINEAADSMTVIIVNKDMNASRNVTVNLNSGMVPDGDYKTLQIASLPTTETFVSHTNNALEEGSVTVNAQKFTITVPKLSTTAVILKGTALAVNDAKINENDITVMPQPASQLITIDLGQNKGLGNLQVFSLDGKMVLQQTLTGNTVEKINVSGLTKGLYILKINLTKGIVSRKIMID